MGDPIYRVMILEGQSFRPTGADYFTFGEALDAIKDHFTSNRPSASMSDFRNEPELTFRVYRSEDEDNDESSIVQVMPAPSRHIIAAAVYKVWKAYFPEK